jgi:hypothetical protein
MIAKIFKALGLLVLISAGSAQAADPPTSLLIRLKNGQFKRVRVLGTLPVPQAQPENKPSNSQNYFADSSIAMADVPDSFQIDHAKIARVPDQGERNVCSFFTTLGLVETYYLNHSPEFTRAPISLSAECLVGLREWMFADENYTDPEKPTASPEAAGDIAVYLAHLVMQIGVPEAKKFSKISCQYSTKEDHISLSMDSYKSLFTNRESPSYGRDLPLKTMYRPALPAMLAPIAAGAPVVVTTYFFHEHTTTSDWMFDPVRDTQINLAGAHSIMLTGYKIENGKVTFTFRNSWGPGWGKDGYGTLDNDLLQASWEMNPGLGFVVSY